MAKNSIRGTILLSPRWHRLPWYAVTAAGGSSLCPSRSIMSIARRERKCILRSKIVSLFDSTIVDVWPWIVSRGHWEEPVRGGRFYKIINS